MFDSLQHAEHIILNENPHLHKTICMIRIGGLLSKPARQHVQFIRVVPVREDTVEYWIQHTNGIQLNQLSELKLDVLA